jgi:hypothetical protein
MNTNKTQAEQLTQDAVSSSFVLFRIYGKDLKCWYGTHRNENQEFQKNIFSNYKLNAYRYTKEEAEKLSKELDCAFEVFVL